jgi:hypothetical protein
LTVDTSSFFKSVLNTPLGCDFNSTCAGDAVVVAPKLNDLEKQLDQAAQNADASKAAAAEARDRRKAGLDTLQKFLDIVRSLNPVLRITSSSDRATAYKRKRAKPQIIGQTAYTVRAHERLPMRIRLSRPATRFLRKWKWLNVALAVTEPGPAGKLRVRTKIVTLRARKHKK